MSLFKVPMSRVVDYAGRTPMVSPFGGLIVASRNSNLSETFHHGVLNTYSLNTPVTANGGAVTVTSGLLKVDAGTSVNGSAAIQTRRGLRYRPGYTSQYVFTAMFTQASAAKQWVGALTTQDGFAVGMNNGVFSILWRRAGVDTVIAASSFDADVTDDDNVSGFVIDPTKLNIFQIDFGYLGIMDPVFSVYGGKGIGWVAMHTIPFVNLRTTTHVANPSLPMRAEVTKTAGASSVSLQCGSWNANGVGNDNAGPASRHGAITKTSSLLAATNTLMMLIRCNATYGGVTNYVNAFIQNVGIATDGNRSVQVRLMLNPTLGGTAPVYTDFDTTNSVISYDTTLTGVTITNGSQRAAFMVEKSGGGDFDLPADEVTLTPGDIIAVTAISAQTNTVDVQVEWDELF